MHCVQQIFNWTQLLYTSMPFLMSRISTAMHLQMISYPAQRMDWTMVLECPGFPMRCHLQEFESEAARVQVWVWGECDFVQTMANNPTDQKTWKKQSTCCCMIFVVRMITDCPDCRSCFSCSTRPNKMTRKPTILRVTTESMSILTATANFTWRFSRIKAASY